MGAGCLVRLDPATELLTKGRFARVAVEIDLQRPLLLGSDVILEGSDVSSFWRPFEYEHVHLFCRKCSSPPTRTSPPSQASAPSVSLPTVERSMDVQMAVMPDPLADDDLLPPIP